MNPNTILDSIDPKLAKYVLAAAVCIKGLQYLWTIVIWLFGYFGKPVPAWAAKVKLGLDDVAMNLPTTPFQASPVVGAPIAAPKNAGFVRILPVFALMVVVSVSCAHLTPLEQSLLNCGTQAVQQQLPGLVSQVNGILQSTSVNWQSALDELLATAGDAAICAVEQVVASLEQPGAAPSPAATAAIARGEAWLTLHTR